MNDRLRAFTHRPEGGYISIAVGVLWETIEAAHNWTYVCEIFRHAGFWSAARESAEPSALIMIACGGLWVVAVRLLRKARRLGPVALSADSLLAREIEAVVKSSDDILIRLHEDRDNRDVTIMKWTRRQ